MKKISVMFFSLLLMLNVVACGSQNNEDVTTNAPSTGETIASESTQSSGQADKDATTEALTTEPAAGSKKVLVVYYSASGNTKDVANYIAAATNADVFELQPVEPYSDDDLNWTDDNSRVVYEHDNPDARDVELVESGVSDWESYDTVFIGASDIIRTS